MTVKKKMMAETLSIGNCLSNIDKVMPINFMAVKMIPMMITMIARKKIQMINLNKTFLISKMHSIIRYSEGKHQEWHKDAFLKKSHIIMDKFNKMNK